ncbi:Hsp70 family protein [Corynebacterium aquatimens]|uniref:Actin-like ATPase involved in cell morphogenesis n=1 Tax=Corynebacterium aquatimens TaxID=1190508 RepID=A0A931GTI5_9CORY|nr:Hsp70 family protein [Corynebacterium aquatimens]MBG6123042.1 actin-like ATPase involved in cell morphogenesis [Corynebacterium aquatimens]WJY66624.1 Chaperone protein DnaK [Corynebacterium aquatimens]
MTNQNGTHPNGTHESSGQWTLAIDFGTSNTAAAHTHPLRSSVEAVNLAHDRKTMTSSVYIETPEDISTGDVAMNRAESNPSGFLPSPKRVIPQQVFQINGYDIPSSVPVAAVLRSVVERASREHNNQRPAELILTHPEAWSDREVQVLIDAASSLGLNAVTVKTVSEPKAAARYYSSEGTLEPGDVIGVFDFGGGTLDIAVLEAQVDGSFSVLSARGDNTLGGRTFDAMIRRWVDEQLEDDHPEMLHYLRSEAPLTERHALEDSIRRAKELLSEASSASIRIDAGGETARLQLTREEFEEIITPAINRAVELTRDALEGAGIVCPDQLKALYLTGGTSRVPMVQEALKDLGPLATLDDPKTVVAQGAVSAAAPVVRNLSSATMSGNTTSSDPQRHDRDAGGASSTSESSSKNRKLIMAVVAAVVAVGGLGGLVWAVTNSGKDEPTPETSAAPTTQAPEDLDSVSAIEAKIPENIRPHLDRCRADGTSMTNAVEIACDVKKDSEDYAFFQEPEYDSLSPQLRFTVNENESRSDLASIRNGSFSKDNAYAGPFISEDGNKGAAAYQSSMGENSLLKYADRSTFMSIESYDFASPDKAMEWLKAKGLHPEDN